jgi:hypothetical protein
VGFENFAILRRNAAADADIQDVQLAVLVGLGACGGGQRGDAGDEDGTVFKKSPPGNGRAWDEMVRGFHKGSIGMMHVRGAGSISELRVVPRLLARRPRALGLLSFSVNLNRSNPHLL